MNKYIKEIIIGGSIIIATIIFLTFNQDTSADHCYNKAYKEFKKMRSDADAAIKARKECMTE